MSGRGEPHHGSIPGALAAPLRLLAGFVVGGAVTPLAFGLAWIAWWPNTVDGLVEVGALLGGLCLIGAAGGAGLSALQPIRRWWQLALVVAALSAASLDPAVRFRAALATDCFYGTSRTEPPCLPGFDWTAVYSATVVAGALVALALGSLGVRPCVPGEGPTRGTGAEREGS